MWMYQSRKEAGLSEAIGEIEAGPDRSAAIVSAALAEDHLTTVLKSSLHQDDKIVAEMFRGSGPIGSFSAKINLAFLTGLLSMRASKEMHIIREVRNEFAHRLGKLSFKSQRIRDLAMNLTMPDWYNVTAQITGKNGDPVEMLVYDKEHDDVSSARVRYLVTCRLFLAFFTLEKPELPRTPRI